MSQQPSEAEAQLRTRCNELGLSCKDAQGNFLPVTHLMTLIRQKTAKPKQKQSKPRKFNLAPFIVKKPPTFEETWKTYGELLGKYYAHHPNADFFKSVDLGEVRAQGAYKHIFFYDDPNGHTYAVAMPKGDMYAGNPLNSEFEGHVKVLLCYYKNNIKTFHIPNIYTVLGEYVMEYVPCSEPGTINVKLSTYTNEINEDIGQQIEDFFKMCGIDPRDVEVCVKGDDVYVVDFGMITFK